jgi:hypothetical protein
MTASAAKLVSWQTSRLSKKAGNFQGIGNGNAFDQFAVARIGQVQRVQAEELGVFGQRIKAQGGQCCAHLVFRVSAHKENGSKGSMASLSLENQMHPKRRPLKKASPTAGTPPYTLATSSLKGRSVTVKRVHFPISSRPPSHHTQLAQYFDSDVSVSFFIVNHFTVFGHVFGRKNGFECKKVFEG